MTRGGSMHGSFRWFWQAGCRHPDGSGSAIWTCQPLLVRGLAVATSLTIIRAQALLQATARLSAALAVVAVAPITAGQNTTSRLSTLCPARQYTVAYERNCGLDSAKDAAAHTV